MLNIILVAVVVIIGVICTLAAFKPDTFRIQRSISIDAKPETLAGLIEDFHQWSNWSPWEMLDPTLSRTYSGSSSGIGAVYEWEGNKKVGKGRMEVIDISENSRILIKLDFFAPFEAHNTAEFTLHQVGSSTNVTWAMVGPASFPVKILHLLMNIDKMVGKDFENGLVNLKMLAEK